MKSLQWPKQVPILDADDIYQGGFDGPNGTHCFIGWANKTFKNDDDSPDSPRMTVVREAHNRIGSSVVTWNDQSSKDAVARMWNSIMRKYGYVVPCTRKR